MKKKVITVLIILSVLAGGVGYKAYSAYTVNTTKTASVQVHPKIDVDDVKSGETIYLLPWALDDGQEVILEPHKINKEFYGHEFVGRFIQTDENEKESNMKTIFFDKLRVLKIGSNEKLRLEIDSKDENNIILTIWVPSPSWIDMKINDSNFKAGATK